MTRLTMQRELVSLWQRSGFTALLVTHDVEEALLMANRVMVLSDRAGGDQGGYPVDRPFPRHRGDPRLADLRRRSSACLAWMPIGKGRRAVIYQIRLIWIDLVARLNAAPFASGAGLVSIRPGPAKRVAMNDRTTAGSGGSLETRLATNRRRSRRKTSQLMRSCGWPS